MSAMFDFDCQHLLCATKLMMHFHVLLTLVHVFEGVCMTLHY